ncbi:hypothetical protein CEXT_588441 [Caerostris extrusa]|uniref:Uncharacterized protein n=1 Tax=Caerostris extrusa TaxID=172846 RepID=A0AAV4UBA6_CAEEX|nr:hypothetical protein CEXT_588441 [Caerostris extrusa]
MFYHTFTFPPRSIIHPRSKSIQSIHVPPRTTIHPRSKIPSIHVPPSTHVPNPSSPSLGIPHIPHPSTFQIHLVRPRFHHVRPSIHVPNPSSPSKFPPCSPSIYIPNKSNLSMCRQ